MSTDNVTKPKERCVFVSTKATGWWMAVEDDWEGLNEDERQHQIYECAMDNDKMPRFHYGAPQEVKS